MKILLVATVSYAGMGPYVCEIINCLRSENVSVFLVDTETEYYRKNVLSNGLKSLTITKHANTRWNKVLHLFMPPSHVVRKFKTVCNEGHYDIIHFLSDESLYGEMVFWAQQRHNVLVTIHDATQHDAQKSIHKLLRQKLLYYKQDKLISCVSNITTNSRIQQNLLQQANPAKRIFSFDFPSLVTEQVAAGKAMPPELNDIENYILFFGRIEKYKGVDVLYRAFIESPVLNSRHKLVIAGSGDIYFTRDTAAEKNVVFINRYIKDEEIASLYQRAGCVVYPYASATQSGVLSLSCYFQAPTIVSSIPYFEEILTQAPIALKYDDETDLQNKMRKMLETPQNQMKILQRDYYLAHYNRETLRKQLLNIYDQLM